MLPLDRQTNEKATEFLISDENKDANTERKTGKVFYLITVFRCVTMQLNCLIF